MNGLTREAWFYKRLLQTGWVQRVTMMQLSWWEQQVIIVSVKYKIWLFPYFSKTKFLKILCHKITLQAVYIV